MAYDEELAARVRAAVAGASREAERVEERRMFGGLAFLLDGHLAVAASGQGGLMVRVDPADAASLVDDDAVTRMEMGGRRMDGWLRVTTEAVASDEVLAAWAARGVAYVRTLPPKP